MSVSSYRDLKVWQAGMRLTSCVYRFTNGLPNHERYGMISQIQRAAVSVPANIAEGHARDSTRDFLRHLAFARGSLAELETLLMIADDLGYSADSETNGILQQCDEASRMLRGLQNSLRRKLDIDS